MEKEGHFEFYPLSTKTQNGKKRGKSKRKKKATVLITDWNGCDEGYKKCLSVISSEPLNLWQPNLVCWYINDH